MTSSKFRRLAVVTCCTVTGEPDGIHLSVEEWSPQWGEWLTGMALCGQSADQGALDPATPVTCQDCEGHRDCYERALSGQPTADQELLISVLAVVARIRSLHHPVQYLGLTICNECSVQRSTGPGVWERIAVIPHPCNTIQALEGEL